ncbi:MAG: hypothetical protein AB7S38_35615 [Vulcanimicrobiota bacterium]
MDLWTLTTRIPRLDANELAKAIEQQVCEPSPDYRTRLFRIEAHCVDPLDVATGKLMSRRTKDLDDLRVLSTHFGPARMAERLELCRRHLEDPEMAQAASENYYVLFGTQLEL